MLSSGRVCIQPRTFHGNNCIDNTIDNNNQRQAPENYGVPGVQRKCEALVLVVFLQLVEVSFKLCQGLSGLRGWRGGGISSGTREGRDGEGQAIL